MVQAGGGILPKFLDVFNQLRAERAYSNNFVEKPGSFPSGHEANEMDIAPAADPVARHKDSTIGGMKVHRVQRHVGLLKGGPATWQ